MANESSEESHRWRGIDLRNLGLSDEEFEEHEKGRELLSMFWNRHKGIVIDNMENRITDTSRVPLGGDDARTVYETELEGIRVVCKTFKLRRAGMESDPVRARRAIRNEYKRVLRELHISAKIKHDNVIGLFLVAIDQEEDTVTLISQSYGGNLKQYLSNSDNIDYACILKGIAAGLGYLHGFQNEEADPAENVADGIVHGDIKCVNVVMRGNNPILIDFGTTHVLNAGALTKQLNTTGLMPVGTLKWMAYELVAPKPNRTVFYSKASDVWSFGMTIYEIVVNKDPYYHLARRVMRRVGRESQPEYEIRPRDIQKVVRRRWSRLPIWPGDKEWAFFTRRSDSIRRLSISEINENLLIYLEGLKALCKLCWNRNPEKRPHMQYVIKELDSMF